MNAPGGPPHPFEARAQAPQRPRHDAGPPSPPDGGGPHRGGHRFRRRRSRGRCRGTRRRSPVTGRGHGRRGRRGWGSTSSPSATVPTPADGFPAIGRPQGRQGLYTIVTHSGVTLAPALGLLRRGGNPHRHARSAAHSLPPRQAHPHMTMLPLTDAPRDMLAGVEAVLTDIDDTLTLHGRLPGGSLCRIMETEAGRHQGHPHHRQARRLVRPDRPAMAGRWRGGRERRLLFPLRRATKNA